MVQQKLQISIHHLAKGYFVMEEQSSRHHFPYFNIGTLKSSIASIMQLITIRLLAF